MFNENLDAIVAGIAKNYSATEIFFTDPDRHFPNKKAIINIIKDVRRVMFPRYFGDETPTGTNPEYFIGETLIRIEDSLRRQLKEALLFKGAEGISEEEVETRVDEICKHFFEKLPEIQRILLTDSTATLPPRARKRSSSPTRASSPSSCTASPTSCICRRCR